MVELLESRIAPATFVVINLNDSGVGSLRDAIAGANARRGPDTIVFERGLDGLIPVTSGQISITDTLTIQGPGADLLGLDANHLSRIFEVSGRDEDVDSPLSISGLAFFNASTSEDGGAIVSFESLKIRNCAFISNVSDDNGGAIHMEQLPGSKPIGADIRNTVFSGNAGESGGAIDLSVGGSIILKNNVFSNNEGGGTGGAANLSVGKNQTLLVENCKFFSNTAQQVGGLAVQGVLGGGTCDIVVRNSLFVNNEAAIETGGMAVFAGDVTIDRTTFSGNKASGSGGGFRGLNFSSLEIRSSRFVDNSTASLSGGGGLLLDFTDNGVARIVASTISGNTARQGGGILLTNTLGELQIVRSVIENNHATDGNGGGVFVQQTNPADRADLGIVRSKVIGNRADVGEGGGIAMFGSGKLAITGSQISQNFSGISGGGVALFNTTPSIIVGSVIADNRADSGGGIAAEVALEIRTSKILRNTAFLGGGIGARGNLDLVATIVSGNVANSGGGIFHSTGTTLDLDGKSRVFRNFSSDGEEIVEF